MRYLITCDGHPPGLTDWYDYENNYNEDLNMVVYDLAKNVYTTDGKTWVPIEIDHL